MVIDAPYMFDSLEIYSTEISVSLSENNDSTYTITYTPSNEWLADSKRVYPVTIDPSVLIKGTSNVTEMTVGNTPNSTTTYYTYAENYTHASLGDIYSESYIKFANTLASENIAVKKATFTIGCEPLSSYENLIGLYLLENSWNSSTTQSVLQSDDKLLDYNKISTDALYTWDITDAFSRWAMGLNSNYGLAFAPYNDSECNVRLHKSSTAYSWKRPLLTVEYDLVYGIEGEYEFQTVDMGRAGTAYVNEYTGNLVVKRDEIGIDGNIMPVSIGRIYDICHFNSPNFYRTTTAGTGWQWDTYYSRLIYTNGNFVLHKSNGEIIDFVDANETDEVLGTKYIESGADEDDAAVLWVEPDASSNSDFVNMHVDDGTYIYRFMTGGKLNSIIDKSPNANSCDITYSGSSYSITHITDGVGRKYYYSYVTPSGGSTQVSAITAKTAENATIQIQTDDNTSIDYKMTFGYENISSSKSRLQSATYPDGETVYYAYDNNDNIISMTNIDGSKLEFTYDGRRVTSYTKSVYDSNTQTYLFDSKVEIDYETPTLRIFTYYEGNSTTPSRIEKVYFDYNQRVIGTYDSNDNISYSQYDAEDLLSVSAIGEDKENIITNPAFTNATEVNGEYLEVDDPYASQVTSSNDTLPIYYLTGDTDSIVNSYQEIDISDFTTQDFADEDGNITFNIGAWAKAENASVIRSSTSRSFGLIVRAVDEYSSPSDNIVSVNYDQSISDWQYALTAFTVPQGTESVYVYFSYANQPGTVEYASVELYQSDLSFANILDEDLEYDPQSLPVGGEITTQEDDNGNVISESMTFNSKSMTMLYDYSTTENYLESIVDTDGNTVYYDYNEENGLLESVSTGNSTVEYEYNAIGALSAVSQAADVNNTISNSYTYDKDRLESISHNGFDYTFEYDAFDNITNIKVGSQSLVSYSYGTAEHRNRIETITYGNGQTITYTYDSDDNVTGVSYDAGTSYIYTYTYSDGKLVSCTDNANDTVTTYTDDGYEVRTNDAANTLVYSSSTDEDGDTVEQIGSHSVSYTQGEDICDEEAGETSTFSTIGYSLGTIVNKKVTDYFERILSKTTTQRDENSDVVVQFDSEYIYDDTTTTASTRINGYSTTVSDGLNTLGSYDLSYEYDTKGNITEIYDGMDTATRTLLYKYTYDEANQVIREDNAVDDKSYTYTYDNAGNIVSKSEHAFTTGTLGTALDTFCYSYNDTEWKDILTSYNGGAITYDEIGNPLTFDVNATPGDTTDDTIYEWNNRQLTYYQDDDISTTYYYNENGLVSKKVRCEKDINGVYQYESTYDYYWDDTRMIGITISMSTGSQIVVQCLYDNDNESIGFIASSESFEEPNSFTYYYVKNVQGDIIKIVNELGDEVVSYSYDAWGNMSYSAPGTGLSEIIGAMFATMFNPFFYRGYYLDQETGLYSLLSRYYDPEVGRFINADDPMVLGLTGDQVLGANLFAYCYNNPVMYSDPTGYFVSPANVIGAIIGGIIGAVGGYFLSRWMADRIGLKGWKRTVFIIGITAVISATAAVIGYFIGPHVAKAGKAIIKALRGLAKTYCFVAGTPVLTKDGNVPIEQIKAGDYVYAENPETGEKGLKQVLQTFVSETYELIHVSVNGETIVTTIGHPFYSPEKGWIGADKLEAGDIVVLANGDYATVEKIQQESLTTPVTVYNFEVEDYHTYYVGNSSVLVHNTGCIKDFLKSPKKFKDVAKLLKDNGFEQVRQQGSHVIFKDVVTGKTFPVPNHGSKQIAIGTLRSILKLAGLL